MTLLTIDNHRIVTGSEESKLVKQKQLFKRCLDEINDLKMYMQELMIENEKSAEEIEQWKETYSREKNREEFWRCRWS